MTHIVIRTLEDSAGFISTWQCGSRTGELLSPKVNCSHPLLLAELQALSHLVVNLNLVGLDRKSKDVSFNVSVDDVVAVIVQPALFDVALQRRSRALRARFADALYRVGASPLEPATKRELLSQDAPLDWTIPIQGNGDVVLTEHAVRRVQERHNYGNLGMAFRHIRRWVKHELKPVTLPDRVLAEKQAKYGSVATVVADDTGWHGVIVDKTLVTMFLRK